MSRTFKSYPHGYYRNPRGHSKAIIGGARKKAIPPDPYDDIPFDPHCYMVVHAGKNMLKAGFAVEDIIHRLVRKFHVSHKDAHEAIDWWVKYCNFK